MMTTVIKVLKFKNLGLGFHIYRIGFRTILSQAYHCEEAWNDRLKSPLLSNLKMDNHFVDIDKKFNNNKPVSGVDIDLFAMNVQDESQMEEMEHLLYRFRKTKYAIQLMDSTIYAVVKVLLKLKNYENLFHILNNQESYGIFPDFYSYNALMDTFIKENMYREAAQIAILMMLQEDFSNEISCYLALYSCQMFLKENSLESLYVVKEAEEKGGEEEKKDDNDDDDEEETLVRVPFLRNPFFDDHFQITNPQHLIGKTFFLVGRQLKNILGHTYHLLGLGMYEKWNMALNVLDSMSKSENVQLLSQGVEEFKKYMTSINDEQLKKQLENSLEKIHNKIKPGELENSLKLKLENLSDLQKKDIEEQLKLFCIWEKERELAVKTQNIQDEKQRRLQEIQKKKEYLYWKEKLLFFFENQREILQEYEKAKEITEELKTKAEEDIYIPPEKLSIPLKPLTKYEKLALVKKL